VANRRARAPRDVGLRGAQVGHGLQFERWLALRTHQGHRTHLGHIIESMLPPR
jgi:hypothetical protein